MEDQKNPPSSSTHLKTPEERAQLVAINREIALCASRKDIDGARAAFQRATRAGWANSHTFSAMINTHVRCGDIEGAIGVFNKLKTSGVKLDVVSCTTMIKGYCSVGDIGGGISLLHEMKRRNLAPNIRTINTIIRGCVATGTNRIGHNVFSCMKSTFGIQPDSSSWEYEVAMLCQGLQMDKVLPMIGRLGSDSEAGDMTHSMSAIYGAVARAAGLRGEWTLSRKYMKLCLDAITNELNVPSADDDDHDAVDVDPGQEQEGGKKRSQTSKQVVVGGKRAWKEMDVSREHSLIMYREHKRAELRQDMQLLEAFVARASASGTAGDLYFFDKVLSFDLFNKSLLAEDCSAEEHLPLLLLKNLVEKFGLDCFIQRKLKLPSPPTSKNSAIINAIFRLDAVDSVLFGEAAAPSSKRGGKKKKKGKPATASSQEPARTVDDVLGVEDEAASTPAESILRGIGRRLQNYLRNDGKIDFSAVFADSTPSDTTTHTLPLRMEICSGSGEWASKQALSEVGEANWVTLEVKQDRVYQTFLRMVFEDVRNLCAISGDAMHLLPRHVANSSVNNVFINHPEPPVQYGGNDNKRQRARHESSTELDSRHGETYGKHLLTLPFFEELERVLAPGGTVTLVTDNMWYGKLILRSLSTIPHPRGLQSVILPTNKGEPSTPGVYAVQEEMSGHVLYRGRPGKDCGHSSEEASSYFDRLWNLDNQPERYFFLLQKVDAASGLQLKIAPKGNMSRMKNIPDSFSQQKTFTVVKTGTKIKFDD